MGKGRKKLPTKIKEMQGTGVPCRTLENEMQVDVISSLPETPEWLSEIGKSEWLKVTNQLFNIGMLHQVDLRLIEAYCNEMSLYIESEMKLREIGRIDEFTNAEGDITRRQSKPLVKIKNDSLANALKLATQFGLTPVARASISAPTKIENTQINNYFE